MPLPQMLVLMLTNGRHHVIAQLWLSQNHRFEQRLISTPKLRVFAEALCCSQL